MWIILIFGRTTGVMSPRHCDELGLSMESCLVVDIIELFCRSAQPHPFAYREMSPSSSHCTIGRVVLGDGVAIAERICSAMVLGMWVRLGYQPNPTPQHAQGCGRCKFFGT